MQKNIFLVNELRIANNHLVGPFEELTSQIEQLKMLLRRTKHDLED